MTKEDFYNIAKTHFENSKIVSKEEFDTALDVYANENSAMSWTMTEAKMPDHDGEYLVIYQKPYGFFEICGFSKKRKKFVSYNLEDYPSEIYLSKKDIKAWIELKRF
mgnify:CR=1 FL=1